MRQAGLLIWLILALLGPPAWASPPPRDEVRVVIDVSGSMKQNDPQNLRAPALRLLVNLLPPDATAGVWSFAQYVNRMLPPGPANDAWRQRALAASNEIHSRGLFTDIGAALRSAAGDWRAPDPATKRTLILLTDGMVDVSKTPGENEKARAQVLEVVLPALRRAGVQVHTIALSQSADAELLKALAAGTGGAFEQTDSAEQLHRIFLRMFERSVKRDTLPLEGNRFTVDTSVQELTLLAFRKPDAAPSRLISPSGKELTAQTKDPKLRWHQESGYDMVTITAPEAGEWRLVADVDPDNRVMIVTDLKLATSEVPNNLIQGELLPLTIELKQGNTTISRPDFLELLHVQVEQQSAGNANQQWVLADNGLGDDHTQGDGVFNLRLGPTLREGEYTLLVDVDGKTFRRQQRQPIKVFPSLLSIETVPLADQKGYTLTLRPTLDWVDATSLRIGAKLTRPDGSGLQSAVSPSAAGQWTLTLADLDPAQRYSVDFQVAGRTVAGRSFTVNMPPVALEPVVTAPAPGEPPPAPAVEPPPEEPKDGVNWLLVTTVLVTANGALFGILGLVYYLIRQRRKPTPGFGDETAEGGPAAAEGAKS